jgi:hypothetical protein
VSVVVVIAALGALGATRPAGAATGPGGGTTYWAETPDGSLVRLVIDGAQVSIGIEGSCLAGP